MKITPLGPERFGIVSHYDPRMVALCKLIPGLQWDKEQRLWCGYRDAVELFRASWRGEVDAIALEPSEPYETLSVAEKNRRPYQLEGVRFLHAQGRSGALLADAMGLGKTCTALTAARALNGRTAVVCPSYVRGVWQRELEKWWPGAVAFLPAGQKPSAIPENLTKLKLVIIHYDILAHWAESLAAWGPRVLILDEAHALQGEHSKRADGARMVAASAEYRWALTGTPPTDRPKDLWNLVDIISPGRFGNFFSYGVRYCGAEKRAVTPTKVVWDFSGRSNLPELRARLSYFMLRRTASDVALELPPKTRQMLYVDVPAKARLSCLTPNASELRRLLDASADAKLPHAWEVLQAHVESGAKVVAFCHRRAVTKWLVNAAREAGLGASLVHGGVSVLRRGAAIAEASNAPGGWLFAATIDSCGTGIDLTFASVGVFVELDWKPQALLQAEARLHRWGQGVPVLIQYVIANGTTDELIAGTVLEKLSNFEAVVGPTGESIAGDLAGAEEDVLASLCAAIERSKGKGEPPKVTPKHRTRRALT